MSFSLPSLKSLHIFSVAAKQLNFSKAADELHITPSAVSHQIRRLEMELGCTLFKKQGKQLYLTDQAALFAQKLNQAFSEIELATQAVAEHQNKHIHLGVPSAFAIKRLMPALDAFQRAHCDIDLRVRMLHCNEQPNSLDLDLFIAGPEKQNGFDSEPLADEVYLPMCTPKIADLLTDFHKDSDLKQIAAIELNEVSTWSAWQSMKGQSLKGEMPHLYFSHSLLMIQAAVFGQGVALIEQALVKEELAAGVLVCLDNQPLSPKGTGYTLFTKQQHRYNKQICRVKSWLSSLF